MSRHIHPPAPATHNHHVAIVGMAGRFPGAGSVAELWRNLLGGHESIRRFSREELLAAGVDPELVDDPSYVPALGALADVRGFDAPFFDYSPLEAAVMDPQLRLFMTVCWEAIEDAGLDPSRFDGVIGLYGGVSMTTYALQNVASHPDILRTVGPLALRILNDKDFLATSVAHRFDFRGPAVTVQTACSTSLVAVHLACRSLLDFECDAVLAGGVTIALPEVGGYLWEQGSIYSPDGRCRPFDASAAGTVGGSGCGVVVLKRLADALAQGDDIYAVIRGSATNNDGALKVGFTAPSVDGQAEVIAAAHALAEVEPDEIRYVETHGTGTQLGDPIEVEALTRVFRERTERRGFCALGSIKANVGHLDQAAGVASLIKLAKVVETGEIPPIPNFRAPNAEIDFPSTPFVVADRSATFTDDAPRIGGVSSFGVGGTNAHVVVEQPPERPPSGPSRPWQVLTLSARTPSALAGAAARLAEWLEQAPKDLHLADVAWSLSTGRAAHAERRAILAREPAEAIARLRGEDDRASRDRAATGADVAFLFPGQGSQYPGMARGLYESEPAFRQVVDRACRRIDVVTGLDLRSLLLADPDDREAAEQLRQTVATQPALFVMGLALAELYRSWGLVPRALLGHSVGELVAATVAGVFHPDDALELVAERGRLVQSLPAGAMLSVALPEAQLRPLLADFGELGLGELDLAVLNAPEVSVVAGPEPAVVELARRLAPRGVETRRLVTSHAFHSAMLEPAVEPLRRKLTSLALRAPDIPFVSNLSGTWITDAQATSPDYWARQLRATVRFADGVETLAGRVVGPWLELGPGGALSALARRHPAVAARAGSTDGDTSRKGAERITTIPTLPHARDAGAPVDASVLQALGRAWAAGARVDWEGFWAGQTRRKEHLPTYAFDLRPYWIDARRPAALTAEERGAGVVLGETGAESGPEEAPASAPVGALETAVAEAFHEVLGVRRVGRHDDFFDLGGHSLLATQVVSRLRRGLGAGVRVEDLFSRPTPAALAALLAERSAGGAAIPNEKGPAVAIARQPRPLDGSELPLSHGQQRLWFLHQLEPHSAAYHMAFALRLDGLLVPAALAGAFDDLLERHEVLRTAFPMSPDGRARQVVLPWRPGLLTLETIDLASAPEDGLAAALEGHTSELARRPFDLAHAPLVRARLLSLGQDAHVLVLVLHHIVTDGWSMGVVVREIGAFYAARVEERAADLPALEVQYADFAAWQRGWLAEEGAVQLEWWRQRFADLPPVLELPADRPRPAIRSGAGARVSRPLDVELAAALEGLGRQHGATLFMVLLATFQALLHRLTGQTDVVVGTPIANRNRAETESLVGFFVNTLALRARIDPAASFSTLLEAVRTDSLAAYEHQDLPFEMLVDKLDLDRDLATAPLFQVLFVLQNQQQQRIDLPGLTLTGLPAETGTAMFDLTLLAQPTDAGLVLVGEYATDRFAESSIERLLERFEGLLRAVVAAPTVTIDALPLITDAEQAQLDAWGTGAPGLEGAEVTEWTLPRRVARHARERPDELAVVGPDGAWTWAELEERSGRLAALLIDRGVAPEEPVAVCLDRRRDLAVALVATLRAGAAYLPLDPTYPVERLRQMLEEARPRFLITVESAEAPLPAATERLERIDLDGLAGLDGLDWLDEAAPGAATLPARVAKPEQVAYVIFTSGSTGRPKGVLATHRGLANLIRAQGEAFAIGPGTRVLQAASLNFDASVAEMAVTLGAGGELHLASAAELLPGEPLIELLRRRRIECVTLTPTVLGALGPLGRAELPALSCLVTAGEACSAELVERWASGRRMINAYGPTETAVCATLGEVTPGGGAPSLGRPIAGARLLVVDARRRPVPLGVPGELCVATASLARGYLGQPARTAAAFLPDPRGGGGRLYRTGDLVCWRPDGSLDFLGRIDHQVKVRGFRIELGEVEAALLSLPEVAEAIVMACETTVGPGRRLFAWVRPHGAAPASDELRRALLERLPEYMVPSAILVLERFPLGPTGKLDRGALPMPGESPPDRAVAEPRDDMERELVALWREVLGIPHVGIHDSFFTLGGDSILSIQLVARARQRGLGLSPQDVFRHQSVAELARVVSTVAGIDAEQGLATGEVPLSPIQRWFFDDLGGDRALDREGRTWRLDHWNQALLLATPPDVDLDRLTAVAARLVAHHDALRLRFDRTAAGIVQRYEDDLDAAKDGVVGRVDVSSAAGAAFAAAVGEAAEAVERSLDLARGPVFRLVHLDAGPAAGRLLAIAHHLVVDAVSWRILLDDLDRLWHDPTAELPAKTTSWSAWSRRLIERAGDAEILEQLPTWLAETRDLAPVSQADPPAPREAEAAAFTVELDEAATEALLRQVPETYQTRIQEVLLAALARAHTRATGQRVLTLDLEGHGRETERFENVDLARTVGWFTTLYPVRLELPSDDPGAQLVAVKEQLRGLPENGFGFGLLRHLRAADGDPRLETLRARRRPALAFNYLGQLDRSGAAGLGPADDAETGFTPADEGVGTLHDPAAPRAHELEIDARIGGGHLYATFTHSPGRRAAADALAEGFLGALHEIIAHCLDSAAGAYTPSDFTGTSLDQDDLANILDQLGDLR